ncbi:MAG: AAA domain-containing protein [Candidatus Bathyarchaeia archaeon]|jgi:hypothetical protein
MFEDEREIETQTKSFYDPEARENVVIVSSVLPSDSNIRQLVTGLWARNLRLWWKAWSDGFAVMEPRVWWIQGDIFFVRCVSSSNVQSEFSEYSSDSFANDKSLQATVASLHARGLAHGNLGNSCWTTSEGLEIIPPLHMHLFDSSFEELAASDKAIFNYWAPPGRTNKPDDDLVLQIRATLEAEELADYESVYHYEIDLHPNLEDVPKNASLLVLDRNFPHPLRGRLQRRSAREFYSAMIRESEGESLTLVLSCSSNPYDAKGAEVRVARAQPNNENALVVINENSDVNQTGWCHPKNIGTIELSKRKHKAIVRATMFRHIQRWFNPNTKTCKPTETRSTLCHDILNNQGIYCVQGPPGTGKTFLATEVVSEWFKSDPNARILVCSKEHLALDLLRSRIKEKLGTCIPSNTLPNPVPNGSSGKQASRVHLNSDQDNQEYSSMEGSPNEDLNEISNYLFKESRNQPPVALTKLYSETAQLVFATTMSDELIKRLYCADAEPFDLVVVEEAGKCYPSELIPVMAQGRNVLLIGDQKQLPPFQIEDVTAAVDHLENLREISSKEFIATSSVLQRIFKDSNFDWAKVKYWLLPFARLQELEHPSFMLNEQYRMAPKLSNMVGPTFYNHEFINRRRPEDSLPLFSHPELGEPDLCWIDIPHSGFIPAFREDRSGQRLNFTEMKIIKQIVQKLRYEGSGKPDLAIITPYNAQVNHLSGRYGIKPLLSENISGISGVNPRETVHTVDSFQGHEADLVILSLVRNNPFGTPRHAWGFVINPERLCVMFSRMRRQLIIVGCTWQITSHAAHEDMKQLSHVLEYVKENGKVVDCRKLGIYY